jgi:hypothetical protein
VTRDRDSYANAGAAGRLAIERALAGGAPYVATRVLLVLLHEGPLWSKLEDTLARSVIERMTGMDDRSVRLGLAWLRDHGVIEWTPGASPKGGKRTLSSMRFPLPDRGRSDPPVSGPPVDRHPGPVPPDPRVPRHQTPRSEAPPTEKETEKTTDPPARDRIRAEAERLADVEREAGRIRTSWKAVADAIEARLRTDAAAEAAVAARREARRSARASCDRGCVNGIVEKPDGSCVQCACTFAGAVA